MGRSSLFLFVAASIASAQDGTVVLEPTKKTAPRIVREAITNQPIHDYRLDGSLELTSADASKKKLGIVVFGRPMKDYSNVKTIIRVTSPPDAAGAALMIWQTDNAPNRIFYRAAGAPEARERSRVLPLAWKSSTQSYLFFLISDSQKSGRSF